MFTLWASAYCLLCTGSSDWHLLVIDGVSAVLLSERTYVPILLDSKTADTPSTTSQRQSDETCSKQ